LEHNKNLETCNLGNMNMNYLKYIKNLETWKSKHNFTNVNMNYLEHIINLKTKNLNVTLGIIHLAQWYFKMVRTI
jgi:hypothetical protein